MDKPLENDYDSQNMQSRKEAFLTAARNRQADDYLRSTREAPLSRYEIKAGWEIPAVLEQSLNSDLPGELKALVTSNVYDTATGLYLLIPQGSRLIGKYDSHVSYGQDGVQVAWSRIIYPDASSVDLDGMMGLDSHGNAGLRDKVDHHYRRMIGFSVLTSMFTAAFEISQRTSQSALTYPTPAQTAGSAVGQELSQTGAQITRRNLNVQPTIKVPAGYKFTVRVNRDILFEAPYEPVQPGRSPAFADTGKVSVEMSKYGHQIRELARRVGQGTYVRQIVLAYAIADGGGNAFQVGWQSFSSSLPSVVPTQFPSTKGENYESRSDPQSSQSRRSSKIRQMFTFASLQYYQRQGAGCSAPSLRPHRAQSAVSPRISRTVAPADRG